MIKKSLNLIIVTSLIFSLMIMGVSAAEEEPIPSPTLSADTTTPVSSVDYVTKKDGANGKAICEEGNAYVNYNNVLVYGTASDKSRGDNVIVDIKYKRDTNEWETANWNAPNNVEESWWIRLTEPNFNEGNTKICPKAKDSKLNEADGSCCTVCVDSQSPSAPSKPAARGSECDPNFVNANSIDFTWTGNDDGCAGMSFFDVFVEIERNGSIINDNEISKEKFIEIGNLENADKIKIKVRANDRAGNNGEWSEFSEWITVDNGKPTVDVILPVPNETEWLKEDFKVVEIDSDPEGNLWKCEYKIVNERNESIGWTEIQCNSVLDVEVSKYCSQDGICEVFKRAEDRACNYNSETEKISLNVDTKAPVTEKIVSEPKYTGFKWMDLIIDWFITDKTMISFNCVDKGIGCDKTFYRTKFDDGNWTDWFVWNGSSLQFSEDGVYFIDYSSEDLLGHIENPINEIDKLDITPPISVKIEEPLYENDGKRWVSGATLFTITARDEEVGVGESRYRIDNSEEWFIYNNSFNLQDKCQDENKEHSIEYFSIDKLGNVEKPAKNQTVDLDCNAPTVRILNPNEQEREVEKCVQPVVAMVNDSDSGIKRAWAELWGTKIVEVSESNETANWTTQKIEDVLLRNLSMVLTSYGTYEALMDKQLPAGVYTLKVMAEDNVGNVRTEDVRETLVESVFVEYISPAVCSIDPKNGGGCEFKFYACMRGGNSIKFWMDKLGGVVTPSMMNAKISKGANSTYVALLDEGIDAGLLKLGDEIINERTSFSLKLNVPADVASQIGTGAHKLDYLIKSFK